jgi:magnesium-protoporphyrin O-methyltransferase
MSTVTYSERRSQLETYFDRTARDAWAQLTSDVKVSGIRQTVREGRDRMRATLLSWLPQEMSGLRLLDAGCGTGALAQAAALRGARVTAVDIAGGLVALGRERIQAGPGGQRIDFRVGDMLDPALGTFDYVAAMDSLIHYPTDEIVRVLARLAPRVGKAMVFTVAPRTPALTVMLAVGRAFPRSDRSPAIEPVLDAALRRGVAAEPALAGFAFARSQRIIAGFYTSQAMELVRR